MATSTENIQQDQQELKKFGYKQELARTMGGFSSFAISFSLISIITGIFANFGYGVQQVGGYLAWSWALVGLGQFLVALVMADLAARFPISGYGYQWASRLTNAHIGYFVGWLLLMQFITGFPGVCQALADTLYGLMGLSGGEWTVTWITVGIISLTTLVHLYGIKLVTLVNDLGVYAEIIGVAIIIFGLWALWLWTGSFDFSNLVETGNTESNGAVGFSAFALSLLVGAWCLTGFEAAADLAEETQQPRKTVPRAVITSQLSAAIAGLFMILAFLLMADSIESLQKSEKPLLMILEKELGHGLTRLIGQIIILSIFACGVASMATATRLIFSLSRDQMLPFSNWLKKVHPTYKTPRQATIIVWLLACLFVIAIRHLELITSISAVAGYLGYSGILFATILSNQKQGPAEGFSLGKWQKPIRIVALVWTLLVVLALTLPETKIEGININHLPALSSLIALLVGGSIYLLLIRKKIQTGQAGPPKIS